MGGNKKDGGKRGRSGGHGTGIMSKRRQLGIGKGCKGVFLTCNRQALDASNEFINLLDRYLEEYGSSDTAEKAKVEAESCVAEDVAAGISAELASMMDHAKRFQVHSQLLPGIVFIQFTREDDVPSDLCHGLLRCALENPGKYSCRHASRLLPMDICAYPSLESLAAVIKRLCSETLQYSNAALGIYPDPPVSAKEKVEKETDANPKPSATSETETNSKDAAAAASEENGRKEAAETQEPEEQETTKQTEGKSTSAALMPSPEETEIKGTWACAFSSRGFRTVKKEQVLDLMTLNVGKNYKVDINNAQHTFLIEANPYFFGVSVVRDYGRFHRYNLHRCCHPEEEENEKKQMQNKTPNP